MLALPSRLKIKNGFGKSAVRHIMKDDVPEYIRLDRKKEVSMSLNLPTVVWDILRQMIPDNRDSLSDYTKDNLNLESQLSLRIFRKVTTSWTRR